jgi:hypothetical protein
MKFSIPHFILMALIIVAVAALFFIASPVSVSAADPANLGASADQTCIQQCNKQKQLADQKKQQTLNCPTLGTTMIACKAATPGGGTVSGQCIYGVGCKALQASGTNGKSMGVGDLSQLLGQISSLLKGLGGQGGGGSPPPSPSPSPTGTGGCTTYYQVSTPSSDPCAYYVPNLTASQQNPGILNNPSTDINNIGNTNTNGTGVSGTLNLGGSGDTSGGNTSSGDTSGTINSPSTISDLLNGGTTNTDNTVNNDSNSVAGNTNVVASSTSKGATSLGASGANGEIRVLPNGATIIISNQDSAGNSVTAGFLGQESSFGNQAGGIVASWCVNRPWASNFLSVIIPPTFFDSLCSLRGYQVGANVQGAGSAVIGGRNGGSVTINNPPVWGSGTSSVYTPGQVIASPPILVNIWAVPAAVTLGGRTTIYWSSKNAVSCTETSPDGSFSQNSVSGGAQTVPLAGATTFTISCMAADGTHATNDVTVNLAL